MSTGWDPGGSSRLICAQIGAGSGAAAGPEDMEPNAFIGEGPWRGATPSPTPPSVALSTTDWSIEWWAKWKYGDAPDGDFRWMSFFLYDDTGTASRRLGVRWDHNAPTFDISVGTGGSVGFINNVASDQIGVWNHHCINVDRSANLEVFVANASKGTDDISAASATDLGTNDFFPLIYEGTDNADLDSANGLTATSICPVVIGPIAFHNRLMTAAERELSRVGRTVQDLTSSVTIIRYNWEVSGESGWDTDLGHMLNSYRIGASMPLGAPTGTEPDVIVVDKSGNGNHSPIPAAASYSDEGLTAPAVADNKAAVAFGIDSFLF